MYVYGIRWLDCIALKPLRDIWWFFAGNSVSGLLPALSGSSQQPLRARQTPTLLLTLSFDILSLSLLVARQRHHPLPPLPPPGK